MALSGVHLLNCNEAQHSLQSLLVETGRSFLAPNVRYRCAIVSCYFDLSSLTKVVETIAKAVRTKKGALSDVTVVVDVGEWIRSRLSKATIVSALANAAKLKVRNVTFLPAQPGSRLLHAKVYSALPVSKDRRSGFVIVTSGNATERGLGTGSVVNVEIATVLASKLAAETHDAVMATLASWTPADSRLIDNDKFLGALDLFSGGCFYHKWQQSLNRDVRYKFDLTAAGKRALRSNEPLLREMTAESASLIPIDVQRIFKKAPRPISKGFWQNYSVQTTMGYWVPRPIAQLVDRRLDSDVAPYLKGLREVASDPKITQASRALAKQLTALKKRKFVTNAADSITKWEERVRALRQDKTLLSLCLFPYEKVPDLLTTEARDEVLQMRHSLTMRLARKKKLKPVAGVVREFLMRKVSREELDERWATLADQSRTYLK